MNIKSDYFRSKSGQINKDYDMMRITIDLPILEGKKLMRELNNKEGNRHIYRTPIIRTKNPSYIELLTIYQALFHSYRLYPNETLFNIYSDSDDAIRKFKGNYKNILKENCDANFKSLVKLMTNDLAKSMPKIDLYSIKSHKKKLGTEAERYNFFVDILCSMKNN